MNHTLKGHQEKGSYIDHMWLGDDGIVRIAFDLGYGDTDNFELAGSECMPWLIKHIKEQEAYADKLSRIMAHAHQEGYVQEWEAAGQPGLEVDSRPLGEAPRLDPERNHVFSIEYRGNASIVITCWAKTWTGYTTANSELEGEQAMEWLERYGSTRYEQGNIADSIIDSIRADLEEHQKREGDRQYARQRLQETINELRDGGSTSENVEHALLSLLDSANAGDDCK